jgi:hypothetical protein
MKGVHVLLELQTRWLGEALAAAAARVQRAWTPLVEICDCTCHAQIHVALHKLGRNMCALPSALSSTLTLRLLCLMLPSGSSGIILSRPVHSVQSKPKPAALALRCAASHSGCPSGPVCISASFQLCTSIRAAVRCCIKCCSVSRGPWENGWLPSSVIVFASITNTVADGSRRPTNQPAN